MVKRRVLLSLFFFFFECGLVNGVTSTVAGGSAVPGDDGNTVLLLWAWGTRRAGDGGG